MRVLGRRPRARARRRRATNDKCHSPPDACHSPRDSSHSTAGRCHCSAAPCRSANDDPVRPATRLTRRMTNRSCLFRNRSRRMTNRSGRVTSYRFRPLRFRSRRSTNRSRRSTNRSRRMTNRSEQSRSYRSPASNCHSSNGTWAKPARRSGTGAGSAVSNAASSTYHPSARLPLARVESRRTPKGAALRAKARAWSDAEGIGAARAPLRPQLPVPDRHAMRSSRVRAAAAS